MGFVLAYPARSGGPTLPTLSTTVVGGAQVTPIASLTDVLEPASLVLVPRPGGFILLALLGKALVAHYLDEQGAPAGAAVPLAQGVRSFAAAGRADGYALVVWHEQPDPGVNAIRARYLPPAP
jgi:hypothetical protein